MKPSIHLDIEVAERTGLSVYTTYGISLVNLDDYSNVCVTTPTGLMRYYLDRDTWLLTSWRPSSDIVIAMELFDKQGSWILWHSEIPGGIHSWRVYGGLEAFEFDLHLAESNISAAHAISLAVARPEV